MKILSTFIILSILLTTGCEKEFVSYEEITQRYLISLLKDELIDSSVEITYEGEFVASGKWGEEYLLFHIKVPESYDRKKDKMTFKKYSKILFEGSAFTLDGKKNRELFKTTRNEKDNK